MSSIMSSTHHAPRTTHHSSHMGTPHHTHSLAIRCFDPSRKRNARTSARNKPSHAMTTVRHAPAPIASRPTTTRSKRCTRAAPTLIVAAATRPLTPPTPTCVSPLDGEAQCRAHAGTTTHLELSSEGATAQLWGRGEMPMSVPTRDANERSLASQWRGEMPIIRPMMPFELAFFICA